MPRPPARAFPASVERGRPSEHMPRARARTDPTRSVVSQARTRCACTFFSGRGESKELLINQMRHRKPKSSERACVRACVRGSASAIPISALRLRSLPVPAPIGSPACRFHPCAEPASPLCRVSPQPPGQQGSWVAALPAAEPCRPSLLPLPRLIYAGYIRLSTACPCPARLRPGMLLRASTSICHAVLSSSATSIATGSLRWRCQ